MGKIASSISQTCKSFIPEWYDPSEIVQRIKGAISKKTFTPYEQDLNQPFSCATRSTWLDYINGIASGSIELTRKTEVKFLYLNLFTVSIDPEITLDDKKDLFSKTLESLSDEKLNYLFNQLLNDSPSAINSNILYFFTDEDWGKINNFINDYSGYKIVETFYKNLVIATLKNPWSNVDKQTFLEKIFNPLSTKLCNDTLYYFMVDSDRDLEKAFLSQCPKKIADEYNRLKREVEEFGQSILSETKAIHTRKRIPFKKYQRQFFLKWFLLEVLNHSKASLFALSFNNEDWIYLRRKVCSAPVTPETASHNDSPHPLSLLSMQWMTDIANRLKHSTLILESISAYSDSGISIFFDNANLTISRQKDWNNISEEDYNSFFLALTAEDLFYFGSSFNIKLKKKLIKNLVQDQPQKLIDWFKGILNSQDDNFDRRTSKRFLDLFNLIEESQCLVHVIPLVFNPTQIDCVLMLSIYSAMKNDHQKHVLNYLFIDKSRGIQLLTEWTRVSLQADIKPYVRDQFSQDIHELLHDIDPKINQSLRTSIDQAKFVNSEEDQVFIDLTLPVEFDPTNPKKRQEAAILKLKVHFLNHEVPHEDRVTFIRSIRKDLIGGEDDTEWFPKLFTQLPEQTWPLIFLHFEYNVCDTLINKGLLTLPAWSSDQNHWIDICTKTLANMPNNPHLNYKKDSMNNQLFWSMQNFFKAISQTNTLTLVMQRFIETMSVDLFMSAMKVFKNTCFNNKQEAFRKLLNSALENSNLDKTVFIQKCLTDQAKEPSRYDSLEEDLWNAPFLNSDEERALMAKFLTSELKLEIIPFVSRKYSFVPFLKGLKNTDSSYAERLFIGMTIDLCKVSNTTEEKLLMFKDVCRCFAFVGFNVLELLKDEHLKESLPIIQEWFNDESLINKYISNLSSELSLVRFFNEKGFISTINMRIQAVLTNKRVSFRDLNHLFGALKELNCVDSVLENLLTNSTPLMNSLKTFFEEHLIEFFQSYNFQYTLPLLEKLVPDYQLRLTKWIQVQFPIEKERAEDVDQFYIDKVKHLFKGLNEADMLKDFMVFLEHSTSSGFIAELRAFYSIFNKDMKEIKC
ncbi:MAG: hypothetical protein S4CHLAM20_11210 [Chlamydiia bacterium]|nr:hypothetical protein [Chlamydiia bacterium]